ncbi:hypothetical protein C4K88_08705 [Arthrobacter pityocampae]|uniref:Uncharacterized protein n=1 Tax=Arthrobacter pityocampae TaxID=547334 RepID=A0A2S5IYX2_9MICC|nr:hypothetical protein C4K88_08705 [Arthrobacter pityocampae]
MFVPVSVRTAEPMRTSLAAGAVGGGVVPPKLMVTFAAALRPGGPPHVRTHSSSRTCASTEYPAVFGRV